MTRDLVRPPFLSLSLLLVLFRMRHYSAKHKAQHYNGEDELGFYIHFPFTSKKRGVGI